MRTARLPHHAQKNLPEGAPPRAKVSQSVFTEPTPRGIRPATLQTHTHTQYVQHLESHDQTTAILRSRTASVASLHAPAQNGISQSKRGPTEQWGERVSRLVLRMRRARAH